MNELITDERCITVLCLLDQHYKDFEPLWPGVVASDKVLSMDQKELFDA